MSKKNRLDIPCGGLLCFFGQVPASRTSNRNIKRPFIRCVSIVRFHDLNISIQEEEAFVKAVQQLSKMVQSARKIIALTGAGVSVESGIPDFRGSGGLWSKYDPMEYAHISAFLENPFKVWNMLTEMEALVSSARPNAAHYALAELEQISRFSSVITQNVDNLHQEAGSSFVIEFHGNGKRLKCLSCGSTMGKSQVDFSIMPPKCHCGGLLKPDVVFFGEAIPMKAYNMAQLEARDCDLILVIGTSAVVSPAGDIPLEAKRGGALLVEINLEETVLTRSVSDLSIHESAGKVLPALVESIRRGM